MTVIQAFSTAAWRLTVFLNYIQLCKTSRGPPSDIRISAEWSLPSGGDGQSLRCRCLLQQPIWSEWETTVRDLWWTVTNQAIKSPVLTADDCCSYVITLSEVWVRVLTVCTPSPASPDRTVGCQLAGEMAQHWSHPSRDWASMNDLCYKDCQAAS